MAYVVLLKKKNGYQTQFDHNESEKEAAYKTYRFLQRHLIDGDQVTLQTTKRKNIPMEDTEKQKIVQDKTAILDKKENALVPAWLILRMAKIFVDHPTNNPPAEDASAEDKAHYQGCLEYAHMASGMMVNFVASLPDSSVELSDNLSGKVAGSSIISINNAPTIDPRDLYAKLILELADFELHEHN